MASQKIEVIGSFKDGMSPALRGLQKSFQALGAQASRDLKAIVSPLNFMRTSLLGLGAALIGSKLVQAFNKITSEGEKLYDTSRALGITTEALSSLRYAVDQVGGSADDVGPALSRLAKTMGQVRGGDNRLASRAFRDLGISLKEVQSLKADEMFVRITEAAQNYGDEADRAAVLSAIFGRGVGDKLLPVLAEGGVELRKMRDEAHQLNITVGEDGARKMAQFRDSMKSFQGAVTGALRDLAVTYLPGITEKLKEWALWVANNKDKVLSFFKTIADVAGGLARALGAVGRELSGISEKLNPSDPDRADLNRRINKRIWDPKEIEQRPDLQNRWMAITDEEMSAQAREKMMARQGLQPSGRPRPNVSSTLNLSSGVTQDETPLSQAAEDWEDFSSSFKASFAEWKKEWTDFGNLGKEAMTKIVAGGAEKLADTLTDVVLNVRSAKEAFKELGKSVVSELARIIIKLLIIKAIKAVSGLFGAGAEAPAQDESAFFAAKGGIMRGNRIPMRNYAGGGIARGPQLALYGEGNNAEAFVPLPDNRSIPVTLNGGGQATNIFNIYANDAASFEAQLMRSGGTLFGMMSHGIQNNAGLRGAVKRAV